MRPPVLVKTIRRNIKNYQNTYLSHVSAVHSYQGLEKPSFNIYAHEAKVSNTSLTRNKWLGHLQMCMSEVPAKVISGGRVTLDSDIRRDLDIEEGDYVLIDVRPMEGNDG